MFSFGKTKPYFTAAFLEKQPRTALYQTRLRNVEEPTQLTWTICLFCLATQKGFSADAVLSVSTLPTLWKNIFPCVLASSSFLHIKIYYYYTAKTRCCQYIFKKRRKDEDIIGKDIKIQDIIETDIIIYAMFSFAGFSQYRFSSPHSSFCRL